MRGRSHSPLYSMFSASNEIRQATWHLAGDSASMVVSRPLKHHSYAVVSLDDRNRYATIAQIKQLRLFGHATQPEESQSIAAVEPEVTGQLQHVDNEISGQSGGELLNESLSIADESVYFEPDSTLEFATPTGRVRYSEQIQRRHCKRVPGGTP